MIPRRTGASRNRALLPVLVFFCALCGSLSLAAKVRLAVALEVDPRTGEASSLVNQSTGSDWIGTPFPLFIVPDGLSSMLEASPVPDGVRLTLRIRNDGDKAVAVRPVFPNLELRGRDGGDHLGMRYCFPARAARIGNSPVSDHAYYSGIAPLQFLAADHPQRGSLHVVIEDESNSRKLFGLDKDEEVLRLFVEHESRTLAPGDTWILPPVLLGVGQTWHSGLRAASHLLLRRFGQHVPHKISYFIFDARKISNYLRIWNFTGIQVALIRVPSCGHPTQRGSRRIVIHLW